MGLGRRRRCRQCGEFFRPDPRVGARQRTCGADACQRARRRQNVADWLDRHPEYRAAEAARVGRWLEAHPGYLKSYRDRVEGLRQRLRDAERRRRMDIRNEISPEAVAAARDAVAFSGVDIRNEISVEMLVLLGLTDVLRRVVIRNQIDLPDAPCYKAGVRIRRTIRRAQCDRKSRNGCWFRTGSGGSRMASAGSTAASCESG
jgi:hypothetical protein